MVVHTAGQEYDYHFVATETATNDSYTGILVSQSWQILGTDIYWYSLYRGYHVGDVVNVGPDEAGGSWSYKITAVDTILSYDFPITTSPPDDGLVTVTAYADAESGTTSTDLAKLSGHSGFGSELYNVSFDGGVTQDQFGQGFVADMTHTKYSFYAIESVSGDVIQGDTYDVAGKYQDGATVTYANDEVGGNWTYHVYAHSTVAVPFKNGSVYDTAYYDGETQTWGSTLYGSHGTASGTNGIGSDSDYASFYSSVYGPSSYDAFGGGGYYEADVVYTGMQKYYFYAVESHTGDIIQGYTFDNTGKYFNGFAQTLGTDEAGGNWTYHVYQTEDARTLGPSFEGRIYDTAYHDAETDTWNNTYYGANGLTSGTSGIGSDYDLAMFTDGMGHTLPLNTTAERFGGGGLYVADVPVIYKYAFYATESVSGDVIQGYLYDGTGTVFDGYTKTFGTDEIGGQWTYHVTSTSAAPGGAVNGQIFDTTYYDGETHSWADGYNALHGLASGTAGIGSDYDHAQFYNGHAPVAITAANAFGALGGIGGYLEADQPGTMAKYSFYATESLSGDVIQGYVYDSTGTYSVGWQHTFATDEDGGQWTYHVYQKDAAPGIAASHDQQVFDTAYYDAQTSSWANTLNADAGMASGSNGIGSDTDYAIFIDKNGAPITPNNMIQQEFGNQGHFVADQTGLQQFDFYATESATGDVIQGHVFAKPGTYSDGFQQTFATDESGGAWTYHVYGHENTGTPSSQDGQVFDTAYYDAQTQSWVDTYYGATGVASGSHGIGSDYDYAQFVNDRGTNPALYSLPTEAFGNGGYFVADQNSPQKFDFYATESATGDVIRGYTYAEPGLYFDGFEAKFPNDEVGGTWTYHIYDHQNTRVEPAHAGEIFDTAYYNAETHEWGGTLYGANGTVTGTTGLGSDHDYAIFYDAQNHPLPIDYQAQLFGGGGYYVADHVV